MSGLAHPTAIARFLERIKARKSKVETLTPDTPGKVADVTDKQTESTPEDCETLKEALQEQFEGNPE
jgi:hypothetical protein